MTETFFVVDCHRRGALLVAQYPGGPSQRGLLPQIAHLVECVDIVVFECFLTSVTILGPRITRKPVQNVSVAVVNYIWFCIGLDPYCPTFGPADHRLSHLGSFCCIPVYT